MHRGGALPAHGKHSMNDNHSSVLFPQGRKCGQCAKVSDLAGSLALETKHQAVVCNVTGVLESLWDAPQWILWTGRVYLLGFQRQNSWRNLCCWGSVLQDLRTTARHTPHKAHTSSVKNEAYNVNKSRGQVCHHWKRRHVTWALDVKQHDSPKVMPCRPIIFPFLRAKHQPFKTTQRINLLGSFFSVQRV